MMGTEQKNLKDLFALLLKKERHIFPRRRGELSAPTERGVYIIYDPEGIVVHVGTTPRAKNGLNQRLKNHMSGKSSFVRDCLEADGGQLREIYMFSYLIVEDARLRALLEAYAIGNLCPKHLGTGQKK